ncbi:MAG: FAD-dependent oxidoreductase, partial [Desulfobacterales bacterium]
MLLIRMPFCIEVDSEQTTQITAVWMKCNSERVARSFPGTHPVRNGLPFMCEKVHFAGRSLYMTKKEDTHGGSPPGAWDEEYDLVVLGGGAAGLSAALVAAIEGKRTLLVEKSSYIGGTTALSSGSAWIPDNAYMRDSGDTDDARAALTYLDALVGDLSDRSLREAFISRGPQMLDYFEKRIGLRWLMYDVQPDYEPDLPGAKKGRRALMPLPYDGRKLGTDFDRIRWPIPELMLFGKMMITRAEAARLLKIGRNLDSLLLGAKLCGRLLLDLTRYKRGTRLVLGNALVAKLFKNLLDRGASVWFNSMTTRLVSENGRVGGLVVKKDGSNVNVLAKLGIVLAGGGFVAGQELRERFFPKPVAQYTSACESCTGDTLLLAQQIGAAFGPSGHDNSLWFPASVGKRRNGSIAVYPHIVLDRAKPGIIAVNSAGRRFFNEGMDYNKFVRAMYESHRTVPTIPAWLVCDRRFVWKYGIGMILPKRISLKPYIKQGYLQVADSLE